MRSISPHDARNISRVALVLCAAVCCAARAEDRPLAAWVPDDVGAYLEMRGIRRHWEKFRTGSHFARLADFPPWQTWREKEGRALKQASVKIAEYFGVDASDLWEKVLGQDLAVAMWPDSDAKREKSPAVFLVRAADAEALERVSRGFRAAQERFEQARWEAASHAGVDYFVGIRPGEKPRVYLAAVGKVGVISESDSEFKAVLATHAAAARKLAELPAFQAAARSVPESAAIWLFVNPRPWDQLLQAEVASAPVARRAEKETVFQTWRALKFGFASVELDPRLRLQGVVKFEGDKLPESVRELAAALAGPTTFLDRTPHDCLLAVAGRLDVDQLFRLAIKHGAAEKDSGSQLFVQALRMLGPDAGLCLTRRERGAVKEGLLDWVAAVHVSPRLRELLPDADELVKRALPAFIAGIARASQDSPLSHLASLLLGDGWRVVEDGVRAASGEKASLAFAVGRLWAAASDAALQRSMSLPAKESLAKSVRWTRHLTPMLSGPNYALFVDCAGWRALLTQHQDELIDSLARQRGMDGEAAQRGFRQLLSVLSLADTLAAAVKIDQETLAFSLSAAIESP